MHHSYIPKFTDDFFAGPKFSDDLIQRLPQPVAAPAMFLKTLVDKTIFCFSSLVLLSGLVPVSFFYDGDRMTRTNLFGFIAAPAASGKGVVKWAHFLVARLMKCLWIQSFPSNTTIPAFFDTLQANHGRGFLLEAECDNLNAKLKSSTAASLSSDLRKIFQGETVERKIKDKTFRIRRPSLSALITGTPEQLARFLPSPENGLFSRFLFFAVKSDFEMKRVLDPELHQIEDEVERQSLVLEEIFKGFEPFLKPTIRVSIHKKYRERFYMHYDLHFKNCKENGNDNFAAMLKRNALIFMRLASIICYLRHGVEQNFKRLITLNDSDFNLAMDICDIFLVHGEKVLNGLYGQKCAFGKGMAHYNDNPKYLEIYNRIQTRVNGEFGLAEARAASEGIISPRTVSSFLKKFSLIENVVHGLYRKKTINIGGNNIGDTDAAVGRVA